MTATVYRFFDRDGTLLYVGMSEAAWLRWTTHSRLKPWWTQVQRCEVEHLPDRVSAMARETEVIRAEHPKYNIVIPVPPWSEVPLEEGERLYGLSEVAAALGMSRQAVSNRLQRAKLPDPDEMLAMGPVWSARRIEPWIEQQKEKK